MIEVFKTNVTGHIQATRLLEIIHQNFAGHRANFDLHDIDNILRIECRQGIIDNETLVGLIKEHGYTAEVLAG